MAFGTAPNLDFYPISGTGATIARIGNDFRQINTFGAVIASSGAIGITGITIVLHDGPNTSFPIVASVSTTSTTPIFITDTTVGLIASTVLTIASDPIIAETGQIYSAYIRWA